MKLLALFSFVLMTAIVASQSTFSGCTDQMNSANCRMYEDFVKCFLRVGDLAKLPGIEERMRLIETDHSKLLKELGVICNIDYIKLYNEAKNGTAGQSTPSGCTDLVATASCRSHEDFFKCFLRAGDVLDLPGVEEEMKLIWSDFNDRMRQNGFDCTVDMSKLFNEVRNGIAGQNTISDCDAQIDGNMRRNPMVGCRYAEEYVRCILRVGDLVNMPGIEEAIEAIGSDLKTYTRRLGLACSFDFNNIIFEVKNENAGSTTSPIFEVKNGNTGSTTSPIFEVKNGNTGSTTSPIGWLVVMVTSSLLRLQHL